MIIKENLLQGSEEWLESRMGKATASQAKRVITPTGKMSTMRVKYMREIARETVISNPLEFLGNAATEWGNQHEDEAREMYMKITGHDVDEVGFCEREDGIIGFSPDGLVLNDEMNVYKGLEIKCPNPDTHTNYLMEGVLPDEHKIQVHWSLAASGLESWDFMSYFPELNPFIIEVKADEFTEKVRKAQDQFILEYAEVLPAVRKAIMQPEGGAM